MNQQRKHAGFADHWRLDNFAVLAQPDGAALVGVEFQGDAWVQGMAHHAAEILSAEPGLVIEKESVEEAVVAGEYGGDEVRMIFRGILSLIGHLSTPILRIEPPLG